jgi:hypothetical protein
MFALIFQLGSDSNVVAVIGEWWQCWPVGGRTAIFDEKKKLIGGLETSLLLQYPLHD